MTSPSQLDHLLQRQNADGGWNYSSGTSWSEPTALACLALRAHGLTETAFRRGAAWLAAQQRSDGGWRPSASVDESTWVTALALLLFPDNSRAANWLLASTGMDSNWVNRLRNWMLGQTPELDSQHPGWSWFPGTASWVTPTAWSIIALQSRTDALSQSRVDAGRNYLLAHRCADGGWNHGGARALGIDAPSYPETTGIALFALAGSSVAPLTFDRAATHLNTCRTAQGEAWLRLALAAHRRPAPALHAPCRTNVDAALVSLAAAADAGRRPFGGAQ